LAELYRFLYIGSLALVASMVLQSIAVYAVQSTVSAAHVALAPLLGAFLLSWISLVALLHLATKLKKQQLPEVKKK
jgi:hypothetical protein